jgi:hypothetical protein
VFLDSWLDDRQFSKVAGENNLSATAFHIPINDFSRIPGLPKLCKVPRAGDLSGRLRKVKRRLSPEGIFLISSVIVSGASSNELAESKDPSPLIHPAMFRGVLFHAYGTRFFDRKNS